jgi:hypothetical protein
MPPSNDTPAGDESSEHTEDKAPATVKVGDDFPDTLAVGKGDRVRVVRKPALLFKQVVNVKALKDMPPDVKLEHVAFVHALGEGDEPETRPDGKPAVYAIAVVDPPSNKQAYLGITALKELRSRGDPCPEVTELYDECVATHAAEKKPRKRSADAPAGEALDEGARKLCCSILRNFLEDKTTNRPEHLRASGILAVSDLSGGALSKVHLELANEVIEFALGEETAPEPVQRALKRLRSSVVIS